jgi:hypothetical protein
MGSLRSLSLLFTGLLVDALTGVGRRGGFVSDSPELNA